MITVSLLNNNLKVFYGSKKKIQKLLREFAIKRDWEQFHNLKNLAISISLESSELLEIFQWDKDEDIDLKLKKELKKKFLMKLLI